MDTFGRHAWLMEIMFRTDLGFGLMFRRIIGSVRGGLYLDSGLLGSRWLGGREEGDPGLMVFCACAAWMGISEMGLMGWCWVNDRTEWDWFVIL